MSKSKKITVQTKLPLDTLVFPRKDQVSLGVQDTAQSNLKKRARSKYYTHKVISPLLIDTSRKLFKQYKRAYFCGDVVQQENNKFRSQYCNSRLCNVCNRIRTAKMMNGYGDQLKNLQDVQFLTLTVKAVKKSELRNRIVEMKNDFKRVRDVLRKRKTPLNGFMKLECNYNPETKTFNPHFHIVLDGESVGQTIIDLWLQCVNNKKCSRKAQDLRACDQQSLNELFKYQSKVLTKHETQRDIVNVHVEAINTILESTSFMKTFQPLGNIKKVNCEVVGEELIAQDMQDLPQYETENWVWHKTDWVNQFGEVLTGYNAPKIRFRYPLFVGSRVGDFFLKLPPHPYLVEKPVQDEIVCVDPSIEARWQTMKRPNTNFLDTKKHTPVQLLIKLGDCS